MVWVVLWEAWYEQGKFFNVVPYPQVLSIPTWFIVRCFRARGFFGPTSPFNQPITLRNWNRFLTAITRRFDLVFWILNFTLWALIYLTITRWP